MLGTDIIEEAILFVSTILRQDRSLSIQLCNYGFSLQRRERYAVLEQYVERLQRGLPVMNHFPVA